MVLEPFIHHGGHDLQPGDLFGEQGCPKQEIIGKLRIVGHTDSIPVQRTNPFQSNQGLSEARARKIAELLVAAGVPRDLISAEGRAATEPIADNGTKDGRARNRRVEIIVQKRV